MGVANRKDFSQITFFWLICQLPYENLTPLQAAVGVVQQGLRPSIPWHTHPRLVGLLERCWEQDPSMRPEFSEIQELLQQLARMVVEEKEDRQKGKSRRRVVPTSTQGT